MIGMWGLKVREDILIVAVVVVVVGIGGRVCRVLVLMTVIVAVAVGLVRDSFDLLRYSILLLLLLLRIHST